MVRASNFAPREKLVRTVVKLSVSRAEIKEFPIVLPKGSDVLSVFGPDEPQFDFDRESECFYLSVDLNAPPVLVRTEAGDRARRMAKEPPGRQNRRYGCCHRV